MCVRWRPAAPVSIATASRKTCGSHILNDAEELLVLVAFYIQVRLNEVGRAQRSAQNIDALVTMPPSITARIRGVREKLPSGMSWIGRRAEGSLGVDSKN
jgi:hypothetical protein